jgi:hypothetical protein
LEDGALSRFLPFFSVGVVEIEIERAVKPAHSKRNSDCHTLAAFQKLTCAGLAFEITFVDHN